jgi:hypothetical protein
MMKSTLLTGLMLASGLVCAQTVERITINDNATCTNNKDLKVSLKIEAPGAKEMMLSNNKAFQGAKWEPFSNNKDWRLEGKNGMIAIFAKFKNAKNEEGKPVSSSILVDTQAPLQGTIKINQGKTLTDNSEVMLYFSAKEADYMMVSNSPKFDDECQWEAYSTPRAWTLLAGSGNRTVYVKFKDSCGNEAKVVTGKITVQY